MCNPSARERRKIYELSVFAGNQQAVYSYFQDDLKLGSKLTLNLGLRHEWTSVPRDAAYQGLNAIASAPGLFDFRKPKSDRNNFAPRFGFAYSPGFSGGPLKTIFGESGRSSVRGGFGVAYDVTFQNLILLQLPPQLQTEQNPELTCAGASSPSWCGAGAGFLAGGGLLQVNVPPATQAEARSATQALIVDQRQPKILTWTLNIQREIAKNWAVEVRYLGTRGLHLPIQARLNAISVFENNPSLALPTYFSNAEVPAAIPSGAPTRAQFLAERGFRYESLGFDGGFVTAFEPVGQSIYHSASVDVTRRLTSGLFMKTNYTFGRNIDNSTNELFSSRVNPRPPQDPYNLRNERGISTLNKPHKFTASWVYDLPKRDVTSGFAKVMLHGWQLNGVYIAESGQPITVLSGVDANGDFDSAGDRAIFNPNGTGLTGSGVNYVIRNSVTGATSISVRAATSNSTRMR